MLVCSCLATIVLIGQYLPTERVVVSGGWENGSDRQLQTSLLHPLNWGPLDHASRGHQLRCMQHIHVCMYVCMYVCETISDCKSYFWFEDSLVDLPDDPDELAAIDTLHKGITHVPCCLSRERTDNGLSPRECRLGAESFFQGLLVHLEEPGRYLRHLSVLNVGHW